MAISMKCPFLGHDDVMVRAPERLRLLAIAAFR